MKKIVYLLLGLLVISISFVSAEEDEEAAAEVEAEVAAEASTQQDFTYRPFSQGEITLDMLGPQRNFYANWLYQDNNDLEDFNNNDIDIAQGDHGFECSLSLSDQLSVDMGVHYKLLYIDFNDTGLLGNDDSDEFHAIDVPVRFNFAMDDRLLVSMGVIGSVGTDFEGDIDHRDFELPALTLDVGYVVIPNLFVSLGVYAFDYFGDYRVIPGVKLKWTPNPQFAVEIHAPLKGEVSYLLDEKWTISAFYSLDWEQYRFRTVLNGVRDQDEFQIYFARVGFAIEHNIMPGVAFRIAAGGTVDAELNFDQLDGNDTDIDGASFFATAGITIYSNFFDELDNL